MADEASQKTPEVNVVLVNKRLPDELAKLSDGTTIDQSNLSKEKQQAWIDYARMATDPLWPETGPNNYVKLENGPHVKGREAERKLFESLYGGGGYQRIHYYDLELVKGCRENINGLYGTRFANDWPIFVIRHLFYGYQKHLSTIGSRVKMPSYDIADNRIDKKLEAEFIKETAVWFRNAIIQDAEDYANKGDKTSYSDAYVRYFSYRLAILFCTYYHHGFDGPIANEKVPTP